MSPEEENELGYLWRLDDSPWVLWRLNLDEGESANPRFCIFDRRRSLSLVLEEDDLFEEVVKRMLDAGVPIITQYPTRSSDWPHEAPDSSAP